MTTDMATALSAFKAKHGRTWKAQLRELWLQGKDEGPLRQVRNAIGSVALDKIKVR